MERTLRPTVLLDLDGTLVDSVFPHVIAWAAALRAAGHEVPHWRIHRGIGLGSERLVPWLLGRQVPDVDALSADHDRRFLAGADGLRPTRGALALVEDLETRGIDFVVATSSTGAVGEALLAALGRSDLPTTDADDVGSSKPAPDLLFAALDTMSADADQATRVGDSPWDAEAARRSGVRCIAVRTGGFGDELLTAAGAAALVDDPAELVGRL